MTQSYTLHPFPDQLSESWKYYKLLANIQRRNSFIEISFQLNGNLSALILPEISSSPQRQDNLWETTCFEFFMGQPNEPEYWEVNLSPKQHWNVYHFSGYRQGMTAENRIPDLHFQQTRSPSGFFLQCQFPLNLVGLSTESLELNLTAVIQKTTAETSYWAIAHAPHEADFHHRASFVIEL